MAKALMVSGALVDGLGYRGINIDQSYPLAVTRYAVLANTALTFESTEAHTQITHRADGVLSNLYVRVTENGCSDGDTVVRTRKNAGNGSQSVTITPGTTGEFEDTSNTDTVTASDVAEWNYSVVVGAAAEIDSVGYIVFSLISSLFAATTNTVIRYAAVEFPDLSDGSAHYYALADAAQAVQTTEAKARFDTNAAANYKNLFVYVSQNLNISAGTNTIVRVRKNGVDTAVTISIPASDVTTKVFEDTTHNFDAVASDDINYVVESVNSGSVVLEIVSIEATSTDQTFHSVNARSAGWSRSPGATLFQAVGGGNSASATEANVKADMNIAATVSNLTLYVATNTILA